MSGEDSAVRHKPRLLVVDDSKLMRIAAARMLGDEFEVVAAVDGEDGWSKVSTDDSIQVVFSDLSMPGLDGYGLLLRIRGSDHQRIRQLPVIVVTGDEADDTAREEALTQGATDFISKPFDAIDLKARARAYATSVQNTRQLEQRAERLRENLTVDPRTGLGNRRYFIDRLTQDRSFALRHRQDLSVLRIDIDAFDRLSAQHGAETAEAVVRRVAELIRSRIRCEDTVARVDVSQFAVALPTANPVGARHLAERLAQEVADPDVGEHRGLPAVSVSIGVTTPDPHVSLSAENIIEQADALLARAVAAGGSRVLTDVEVARVVTEPEEPPPAGAAIERLPEVGPVAGIDAALELIAKGDTRRVASQLPELLQKLMPLLQLAEKGQRYALFAQLERCGTQRAACREGRRPD